MAFERFTGGGRSYKARASIRKNGQIGLSQGAVQRFKLDRYPYVVLFYDKETERIGIKPTQNPEEPGAYRLNHKGSGADISGLAFLEYFGIDRDRSRRYEADWDDEQGMLVIDLEKPVS